MTPHPLPAAACTLARALAVGLVLVGATVCLLVLRLSPAWGLLALLGSTATGLLVLTGQGLARRLRLDDDEPGRAPT
jgi:nucleotide-binding universal stress UspA family protein